MNDKERSRRVQMSIRELQKMGIDYNQMSVLLNGAISTRTLYRWAKGDTSPQRAMDVELVEKLEMKCRE